MGRALHPPPSFGQNPKEQPLFFREAFPYSSIDYFQPVEAHKVRHDHEIGCAQEMLVHNPPDIDFMIGLYIIVEYQNYVLPSSGAHYVSYFISLYITM